MLTISDKGLNVIKAFEGCALRAYRDSVGVWTIGYGLTNYDKNLPWKVQAGLTITQAEADEHLVKSLMDNYEPDVRKALPDCTQAQFDAGDSFDFNTGAVLKATWPGALGRKDFAAARLSIMSWNKAGGKVLAGLTRRRQREWAMIESADYGPEGNDHASQLITKNEDNGTSTGSTPKPTTRPGPGMLALNDHGTEVTELQGWLKDLGLTKADPSGTFDEGTEEAVVNFQKSHKQLTVDGIVGPATRNALMRDIDARGKSATASKAVVAAAVSGGIAWKAVGAKLALAIVSITGVAALGLLIYVGFRYRDEIAARFNRLIGRETP